MMRTWIPPVPLALGIVAFGFSWVVLLSVARTGSLEPSFLALGWVHLVILGWITLIALSILLHVIPNFLDVSWRGGEAARWSILFYAAGVITLLTGFFGSYIFALQLGATLTAGSLLVFILLAIATLGQAFAGNLLDRAVARAFILTLSFLLLTALLGIFFVYTLFAHPPKAALSNLPQVHAILGIGGWLTLLVMGVSVRTIRPITGARSRIPMLHAASGGLVTIGTLVAAVGRATSHDIIAATGCIALLAGSLVYAFDICDTLLRATVAHRGPQILVFAAAFFAVVTAALALGAANGLMAGSAAVYSALIGWIGNAVIAHLHHIGVRVLLTMARGDEDETRPGEVLRAPLTWTTVILYELAAVVGIVGILTGSPPIVAIAALFGFASFLVMVSNFSLAWRCAKAVPLGVCS